MWKVASGTVQDVVEQLKMGDYIHQKVGGYSLGMRQRLCFALVLVTKADYMLVDEVMNGLDPDNVELISKVLRQLRDEGKTIVMASHLLNNLDSIADKIYFMKELMPKVKGRADGKLVNQIVRELLNAEG